MIAVLTVGQFLMPGAALDVAQTLFLLSLLPVAWFAWRRADATPTREHGRSAPSRALKRPRDPQSAGGVFILTTKPWVPDSQRG